MLPDIVSETEWRTANDALVAKEKAHTRAGDALAAERRRLPMTPFPTDFSFQGPYGELSFLDLFEGRPQLLLYHFWFPEDGEPCGGCTMFSDQVPPLEHVNARDVTFALVSRAPQDRIAAYKERMGWSFPWYTGHARLPGGLRHDGVLPLQCFLRVRRRRLPHLRDDAAAASRHLGSVWTFLDKTPFGRQEDWEDSPPGRPQEPPYQWWRKKDEY